MKLKLENVCLRLSNKNILDSIHFSVEKGSFVSVLGSSGCGKSTLLKAIAGVLPDYTGDIIIDGKSANKLPAHKRNTVIVFQDIRLFPHMNVEDNISFALKMKRFSKEQSIVKVAELLERVQLAGFEKRRVDQLSGGQQQRVALARALAAEPEILLLDEPFSGLDENLRFDMKLLLMELHRAYGMTTIMVTHDKEEALSLSDRIIVMEDGGILQAGTPREVYEDPIHLTVAKYFGNATFVTGVTTRGIFQSPELSVPCQLSDGEYVLMIRNDSFTVVEGKEYKVIQRIYTGKEMELLLQHNRTRFTIRYRCDKHIDSIDEQVSITFHYDRLRFFDVG